MGKTVDILSTVGEAPGKFFGFIEPDLDKPKKPPADAGAVDPHRGEELAAARKRSAALAAGGGGRRNFRIDLQAGGDTGMTRSGLRIS